MAKKKEATKFMMALFSLSGIFFLLFPIARPFFDETTIAGVAQFASARWVLAHALGMFGLILMPLGFFGAFLFLEETRGEKLGLWALVFNFIGAGLTLPFFGAEAFGLQIIGKAAVSMNDSNLIPLINQVRFGPGLLFIGIGLLTMSIAAIMLAVALRRSNKVSWWTGLPLAISFALFLPLLQGNPAYQWIRIFDGAIIAIGCLIIAEKVAIANK